MEELRAQLLALNEKRGEIESEIETLVMTLRATPVGVSDSLINDDGYPRDDVDVYTIRHQRHRLACLKTDHKEIMKEIEREMLAMHSIIKTTVVVDSAPTTHNRDSDQIVEQDVSLEPPFALVDLVFPGSPAAEAGLCTGDRVVAFGSVTNKNNNRLKALSELVGCSIGQEVVVEVERGGVTGASRRKTLTLTPQRWNGQGVLGCHLVPYDG